MLAHAVGAGALPAPPWLLAYLGIAVVLGTAVALRATWTTARAGVIVDPVPPEPIAVRPGHIVGLLAYAGAVTIAFAGPNSSAANLAPWLVAVVWWVALPLLCLLLGDVVRHLNPFVALVALLDRGRAGGRELPAWTPAAFLAAWTWYLLAYLRPGSPRALGTFMLAYAAASVVGGLWWGRAWLRTGEAFGAISAAVARVGVRGWRSTPPVLGTAALMVVWIGSTAYDGFTYRPFWEDVLGTSTGWARTFLSSIGLLWITAIVFGAYLLVVRVAERGQAEEQQGRRLMAAFGPALVPLAVGWFLGHDLTLLLAEGQNAYALASDPLARGWDLFGTYDHTVDYSILTDWWVPWLQLGANSGLGHVGALVLLHQLALERLSPRAAMRTTWTMAVVASASITAAALLVLT